MTEEKGDRCRARNIGIKAATGEWITFSDADDRIEPDHLQRYMDKAREEEADIIMGGFKMILVRKGMTIEERFPAGETVVRQLAEKVNLLGFVWNKIFSASFLRQSGVWFREGEDYEDLIYVYDLLHLHPRLSTLEMGGYRWMCRDESSATSSYRRGLWEAYQMQRAMALRLQKAAGFSEEEMATRAAGKDYIGGYGFVCNLFKKGSPLSLSEARREIKRVIFDNASMRQAIVSQDRSQHDLLLKIYDRAYDLHSPLLMALLFRLLFTLKYTFQPLSWKILPRLRR